jgi:hypothetical protein
MTHPPNSADPPIPHTPGDSAGRFGGRLSPYPPKLMREGLADIGGVRRTGLSLLVEQLVGTPIEIRQVGTVFVAVPVDRALLRAPTWRALRAGPRGGVGNTEIEALLLLAFAAGRVAGGARRPAAPQAADAWLRTVLEGAGAPVPVAEVTQAARRAQVSPTAIRRAARRLGVVRRKAGMRGGWVWGLPVEGGASADGAAAAGEPDPSGFGSETGKGNAG